jgi:hypothetical protein
MGLDIYFSKVGSLDYSMNKETAINDQIEIGYFRKVNCLLPHFGYVDNCEYLEIERWQIEDLVYKAKELLAIYESFSAKNQLLNIDLRYYKEIYKNNEETCNEKCQVIQRKIDSIWKPFEEVAEQKLPTSSGCFFGSQEYRDWYVADLKEIVEVFEKILDETDFDVEQVLMYCWW